MSASRVIAVLLLTAPLAACVSASSDCVVLPLPTATPLQYAPTPVGGFPVVPGACPEAPTATPWPPASTATAGPGLGQVSNVADTRAFLPEDERLQAVFASSGRYAVVYRLGTELVVAHTYGEMRLAGVDYAGVAYRADQVALVQSSAAGTTVSFGTALGDQESATVFSGPGLGSDLALSYGGEGWLYLASGSVISRFNPAAGAFEASGLYTGQAITMGKTAHGTLLLATTDGVWRKPFDQAWDPVIGGPVTGMAVIGEQVAVAWAVEGGAGGWFVRSSMDGGASWSGSERAAYAELGSDFAYGNAEDGGAFPVLYGNTTLEVVGPFREPPGRRNEIMGLPYEGDAIDPTRMPGASSAAAYPTVVRRTSSGWYPDIGATVPELLVSSVRDAQPVRHLLCAQSGPTAVCAWEAYQVNGQTDVVVITR